MHKHTLIRLAILSLVIILVLAIIYFSFAQFSTEEKVTAPVPVKVSFIKGCYVAKIDKDIYTLNIQNEDGGVLNGILTYNYETKKNGKENSTGTINGAFAAGILLGNYSLRAGVTNILRQVIFKKVGSNFIEGFGPIKIIDNRETGQREIFDTVANVSYDTQFTFVKSETCN